jgi:hypothetical protein
MPAATDQQVAEERLTEAIESDALTLDRVL